MKSAEIRQKFLEYFQQKGHTVVPSSSLVPNNDPTLLFTNAGMVQFKEIFLGLEKSSYSKAVSVQRCLRAGGKHNDLENVGYTARHHTFFEMLGNFSFGDYFKREAIQFAWEFLTKTLNIPAEKLWITVFRDDDEAADIWLKEMKVDPSRFSRCDEHDNFWSMGDTGPCGPCSEIFYDHGPSIPGGPPGTPEADGDRYIEIWNLVFMQFNRFADGRMEPLPKPSVDTGMGLERVAAVVQDVHNNYDTDIFSHLIDQIALLAKQQNKQHPSLKVIADHIRSSAFLISDGVIPSNEGRGYVLRRIIRRALRHGSKLGLGDEPFFYRLVKPLVEKMGEAYPEMAKQQAHIERLLQQEEEQFVRTLLQGLKIFEQDIAQLSNKIIPGEIIFKLYDTYGFPVDLTGDIARERGLSLDIAGFEQAMARQQQLSQSASRFNVDYSKQIKLDIATAFKGYESLTEEATIEALLQEGDTVSHLRAGEAGAVVLAHTPFYAESGGQVGDQGVLTFAGGEFEVKDTQKMGDAFLHYGQVKSGELILGKKVTAKVDMAKRLATMQNHSATHLLHAALRQVLGAHVTQKGSLVAPDRLRFDFTHYEGLTPQQIVEIESLVNEQIQLNNPVVTALMTPEEATANGAMALFGEKYGDTVRVLSMGEFSKELCGGTHTKRTGDIGAFKIIAESGIAAGIRRLEAVTGMAVISHFQTMDTQLTELASWLKIPRGDVLPKVQQVLTQQKKLEKEIDQLKAKLATSSSTDLTAQAEQIAGINVLVTQLPDVDAKALRSTLDHLKDKLSPAVVVLVTNNDGRMNVIAGLSKECIGKAPSAAELVRFLCGKGGGREDMAQGGGELVSDLPDRLAKIRSIIKEKIQH